MMERRGDTGAVPGQQCYERDLLVALAVSELLNLSTQCEFFEDLLRDRRAKRATCASCCPAELASRSDIGRESSSSNLALRGRRELAESNEEGWRKVGGLPLAAQVNFLRSPILAKADSQCYAKVFSVGGIPAPSHAGGDADEELSQLFYARCCLESGRPKEEVLHALLAESSSGTSPPASKLGELGTLRIVGSGAGFFLLGSLFEQESRQGVGEGRRVLKTNAAAAYWHSLLKCPFLLESLQRLIILARTDPYILLEAEVPENFIEILYDPAAFSDSMSDFGDQHTWASAGLWSSEEKRLFEEGACLKERRTASCCRCSQASAADVLRKTGSILSLVESFESRRALRAIYEWEDCPADNGFILELIGRCYFEMSRYALASAFFEKASALHPNKVSHLPLWSSSLWQQGRKSDLERLVETSAALECFPKGEVWAVFGNYYSLCNDTNEALNSFQTALRLTKNCPYLHTLCAYELVNQDKFEDAKMMFFNALAIDPGHYNAHCGLAKIYAKEENHREAVASYGDALRFKKDSSAIFLQMAHSFEMLGKNSQALMCYQQASKLDPTDSTARFRMALIMAEMQQYTECLENLRVAEKLAPLEPATQVALSQIYSRVRKTKTAWRHMHRALHLATDTREQQIVRDKLLLLWNDGFLDVPLDATGALSETTEVDILKDSEDSIPSSWSSGLPLLLHPIPQTERGIEPPSSVDATEVSATGGGASQAGPHAAIRLPPFHSSAQQGELAGVDMRHHVESRIQGVLGHLSGGTFDSFHRTSTVAGSEPAREAATTLPFTAARLAAVIAAAPLGQVAGRRRDNLERVSVFSHSIDAGGARGVPSQGSMGSVFSTDEGVVEDANSMREPDWTAFRRPMLEEDLTYNRADQWSGAQTFRVLTSRSTSGVWHQNISDERSTDLWTYLSGAE